MLIRTNLDQFWAAYSEDHGLYWRVIKPSGIAASSAPGYLLRLASGRLALIWNQLCANGETIIARAPASHRHETAESWYREELSMALSEDDGGTWSKPVVVAEAPGGQIGYPYMLERKPGEIWVFARWTVAPENRSITCGRAFIGVCITLLGAGMFWDMQTKGQRSRLHASGVFPG